MHCDAEVINKVAFGEHLGALEYEEQEDGTVQLATQEILEVPCSDQPCLLDMDMDMLYDRSAA